MAVYGMLVVESQNTTLSAVNPSTHTPSVEGNPPQIIIGKSNP